MRSIHNKPMRLPDDLPDSYNFDELFIDVRKHLTTVRRYHVVFLWLAMFGFLPFALIAIFLLLLAAISITTIHEPSDKIRPLLALIGMVSSGGIGTVLLPFLRAALSEHRNSQVDLADFESLVVEARAALAEIPTSFSSEQRRQIRAEIWKIFRAGLTNILKRNSKK